jgi:predicted RNA-binding protein with PIN domain
MILVIDAFNLMYKFPDLEDFMQNGRLEDARRGILSILLEFRDQWKKPLEIHLFIDGKKRPGDETSQETVGGINVYYSLDLSADYAIRMFVKNAPSPGEIRVISSDKQVMYHAKKNRCHVQKSEEFAVWIKRTLSSAGNEPEDVEDSPELSEDDIAFWQTMFSKERKKKK